MLYSGSYDHSIRSWDLREMYNRIRERAIMYREDINVIYQNIKFYSQDVKKFI
jgi:F-box and WD-40 domain protein 1/11/F-box/WD-40 domain protein 7